MKEILDYLWYHPDIWWVYPPPEYDKWSGVADILASKNGQTVEIFTRELTDQDLVHINKIKTAGGLAGWADSVEKAKQIVEGV